MAEKSSRLSIGSWCLYDWGNSAFATVIITFVFSVYFGRGIVGDETQGAAYWGMAIAASGLLIAVLSPIMGAIADQYGARKPWVWVLTLICAGATFLLFTGAPGAGLGGIIWILALIVIANAAFETALVFNNAMLPHLTSSAYIGRVSGWAWGAGYAGGLACLVVALVGLVGIGDIKPLISLPQEQSEHIRAVGPLVALWVVVFTIPMMLFTRDVPRVARPLGHVVRDGIAQTWQGIKALRGQKNLLRYLIASAIYRDGLNTLFAMGGLFAAGTFGMSFQDILIFAIGLNVTSAIGAVLFSFMDDFKGSKKTIMLSLIGLIVAGCAVLMVQDKNIFIALALIMGLFIGPVQSASRTLAARIAPLDQVGQVYGLYALTGRVVSFFGPALYAIAVMIFETQRAGMATILLFWLVGMVILMRVKEQEKM